MTSLQHRSTSPSLRKELGWAGAEQPLSLEVMRYCSPFLLFPQDPQAHLVPGEFPGRQTPNSHFARDLITSAATQQLCQTLSLQGGTLDRV